MPVAEQHTCPLSLSKIASTLVLLTTRTFTSQGLKSQQAIDMLATEKEFGSGSDIGTRVSLAWRNLG